MDVKKVNLPLIDKRRTAIGNELIHLQAVLGEAQVSVGELASLAVNDVIVLTDVPSNLSHLITHQGRHVANVALGRVGAKRAVMIAK
jgi:flagellar motor switch protein FliM